MIVYTYISFSRQQVVSNIPPEKYQDVKIRSAFVLIVTSLVKVSKQKPDVRPCIYEKFEKRLKYKDTQCLTRKIM